MKNICLELAYKGTAYAGFQSQKNALAIEDVLKDSLRENKVDFERFTAAGRTDAGVHARKQVVNFFTDTSIPPKRIALALNTKLPADVRILRSFEVGPDFHSRYSALGKHYNYKIYLGEILDPFYNEYAWHFPHKIERELVYLGAKKLAGKHDFGAFKASGSSTKTTFREIYGIFPHFGNNTLEIDYIGSGFLYNMVRILTGTILEVASKKHDRTTFDEVFLNPVRDSAGITAPPQGLFLEDVFYDKEELGQKVKSLQNLE